MNDLLFYEYSTYFFTGDYGLDSIYPNDDVCPRLNTLEDSIYATPEYLAFNTSAPIQQLTTELNAILGEGYWFWDYVLDCFMTTVCTDRPIPSGNPSTGIVMNQAIFNATISAVEFTQDYLMSYNNSQWAKLAMGNTIWHSRTYLQSLLNNSTANNTNPYKFVMFSGHDTTIQPVLSALLKENWNELWPGYASMITIEIYNASALSSSDYLFRIVYNSEPLIMPGCDDSLCDINVLLDAMAFAEQDMPCAISSDTVTPASTVTCNDDDDDSMSTTDWTFITIMASLLGAIVGGSVVIFFNKYYFSSELTRPLLTSSVQQSL
jgi:hypothetical protein